MPQDPNMERLRIVAQAAQRALANGGDPAAINRMVQEDTGLANLPAVITKLRGGQTQEESAAAPEEASGVGGGTKAAAVALSGATAGLAGPLMGLGERVGIVPEGAREGFEFARDSSRRENPVASGVGEFAAGMLPGLGLAKGGMALAKGAGQGAARLAGRAGMGAGARATARAAGTAAGAMGAGAAEGGLLGATTALGEGADAEGIKKSAGSGAVFGGLLGGVFGAGAGTKAGVEDLTEGMATAGTRLRGQVTEQLEQVPALQGRLRILKGQKNAAYESALQGNAPAQAATTVMRDPVMAEALAKSGPPGQRFMRRWRAHEAAVAAGKPSTPPDMPAVLLDDLKGQLDAVGDTFKKAKLGADPAARGAGNIREAGAASARLDNLLDNIPGYRQGSTLARLEGTQSRALDAGKKAWGAPADEVLDTLNRMGSPEEAVAYRVGLARKFLQQLGGTKANVKTQITKLLEGDEGAKKARALFGSDEAFERFMASVRDADSEINAARIAKDVIKYAGFTIGGSSLLGLAGSDLVGLR